MRDTDCQLRRRAARAFLLTLVAIAPVAGYCPARGACKCCAGVSFNDGCPPCPCPPPPPSSSPPTCPLQSLLDRFEANYLRVAAATPAEVYPERTADANGTGDFNWQFSPGWRSGFYPGLLWQLANNTGKAASVSFASAATRSTAGREGQKTDTSTHDVGFVLFCSFGNGLELSPTPNQTYASVLVQGAHSLARRFSPVVGMTRSWGDIDDQKEFEVIIDNLMNLELLFWAAKHSNNATLGTIAASHANRTGQLWVRPDGSTPHLCVFSPATGGLLRPCTATPQGLSANSTWARGQGWAVYGFTMAYRYTRFPHYLVWAKRAADYYMAHSRKGVPLWDFEAMPPQDYPDTSAAAITASALLELADHTKESHYVDAAVTIVESLSSVRGLLSDAAHSQAVLASNEADCKDARCTLIESDYYLYEALRRFAALPPHI
jgi:unsaturated chondroitin disaccharide hydrolase